MAFSARSRLWAGAAGVLAIATPVAVTAGSAHVGNPAKTTSRPPAPGLGVPDVTEFANDLAASW